MISENQILNDQDLNQNGQEDHHQPDHCWSGNSLLLDGQPQEVTLAQLESSLVTSSENNFTGEFDLPVLTQIVGENIQSLQSLDSNSQDGVQGLNHQEPFNQNVHLLTNFYQKVGKDWSGTSLFLDGFGFIQEDDLSLASLDPTLVTGQVIFMKLTYSHN